MDDNGYIRLDIVLYAFLPGVLCPEITIIQQRHHTIEEAVIAAYWGWKQGYFDPSHLEVDNRDGTYDLVMDKDTLRTRAEQWGTDRIFRVGPEPLDPE